MIEADAARHIRYIKRTKHVLDVLATWPLRYAVILSLCTVAVVTIVGMLPPVTRAVRSSQVASSPSSRDILSIARHIADAHLFGQTPAQVSARRSTAPMDVTIEGLVYSEDQTAALAILTVDGNSKSYSVGDLLPDGEKLAAIAPNAIQLVRGDTQRVIEMPTQFGSDKGILLAGDTGLAPRSDPFGLASPSDSPDYKPVLQPVLVPQGASPLDQLRALRTQLIQPAEHESKRPPITGNSSSVPRRPLQARP